MSYDKQTLAQNRYYDYLSIERQVRILRNKNVYCSVNVSSQSRFRKQTSMTCHCRICRKWKLDESRYYRQFELERKGMKNKLVGFGDGITGEEEWVSDERPDIITQEEDWI